MRSPLPQHRGQRERGRPVLKLGGTTKRILRRSRPNPGTRASTFFGEKSRQKSFRFLERKLGKELCAKLRFASAPVLYPFQVIPPPLACGPCFIWRCSFLSDQKGTKESPRDGSDERLRAAGAHSHLSPGPPFTKAGNFGLWVTSGGLIFDRAISYSRPTGASYNQNLKASTF